MRVAYLDSHEFDWHEGTNHHPECPERLQGIRQRLEQSAWGRGLLRPEFSPADRGLLEEVHDPDYLSRLERLADFGGGRLDADTYVTAHSFEVAQLAAGAVARGVRGTLHGEFDRAFCAVRPSGHHATAARGMGFCLLNNVMIGAQAALDEPDVERVAIFDWDVHHGNGTEALSLPRREVFFASVHQYPAFPFSGEATVRGEGAAQGTNLNVPLPPGSGDTAVLAAWDETVGPALEAYNPDLVLVSAGFDGDARDPLAEFTMTTGGYRALTRRVVELARRTCKGRLVSVLEGGYDIDALAEDVEAHLEELHH